MLLSGSDVLDVGVADATERLNSRVTGLATVISGKVDSDALTAARNVTRMEAHSIMPVNASSRKGKRLWNSYRCFDYGKEVDR